MDDDGAVDGADFLEGACMCVYVCVWMYMGLCGCVCVCVYLHKTSHTHTCEDVEEAVLEDTDDGVLGPGGVQKGADDVEGCPDTKRLADGCDFFHGWVHDGGEHEPYACGFDAFCHLLCGQFDVNSQRFQHIRRATFGGYGPIPQLGCFTPTGRGKNDGRRRDINRMCPVPPRAHNIQQFSRYIHGKPLFEHRSDHPCDFDGGLSPLSEHG